MAQPSPMPHLTLVTAPIDAIEAMRRFNDALRKTHEACDLREQKRVNLSKKAKA